MPTPSMSDISTASSSVPFAATGVIGDNDGSSLTIKTFIAFCAGLSMYNALELLILIFLTVSHYRSRYF
ncbi:hypothetical protein V1519DRAFT_445542 [Lipomyces tetrasporus]